MLIALTFGQLDVGAAKQIDMNVTSVNKLENL